MKNIKRVALATFALRLNRYSCGSSINRGLNLAYKANKTKEFSNGG